MDDGRETRGEATHPALETPAVSVHTWRDWPAVSSEWDSIVQQSPYASFFHSSPWIQTWMDVYGPVLRPQIVIFRGGSKAIGACLLVTRWHRRGPIPLRQICLNACGEDEAEETSLEFNDLLCVPGSEDPVACALASHLGTLRWDEFWAPACSQSAASAALKHALARLSLDTRMVPSYFIDFDEIRTAGTTLERGLSANSRYSIRQSIKTLESAGPTTLERAEHAEQALGHLRELAQLHQRSWRARGALGAFHSPRFVRFHEEFVRRGFDLGLVETSVLRCGSELIGGVYCVGWRGTLYFYQGGFKHSDNRKLRPGVCTLVLSIQRFLSDERWRAFDMMAGDTQFKRTFSKRHRMLEWMTFRRSTVPMRLVLALQRLRPRGTFQDRSPVDASGPATRRGEAR